jgi:chromosome partitioning protein
VDLDPQANDSSAFSVANSPRQIYDALIGDCGMQEVVVETELEYLQCIPSGQDLVGAEIELVSTLARERRLELALKDVSDRYEFIIIDCPPSLGILTLNALTAADSILIPLQCEYYALEGLARLVETMDLVRAQLNPRLALEGIMLTMVDMRNNLSRQVEAEVRRHFGEKVYRTRIPRNVRLSEAPSHGKPVLLYDVHSRGAVAYIKLAEEILSRFDRLNVAPAQLPDVDPLAPADPLANSIANTFADSSASTGVGMPAEPASTPHSGPTPVTRSGDSDEHST